jgi:hypothetical protein
MARISALFARWRNRRRFARWHVDRQRTIQPMARQLAIRLPQCHINIAGELRIGLIVFILAQANTMTEEFQHVCLISSCTRNQQPFKTRASLKRHLREGHHGIDINCHECGVNYTNQFDLQSHMLFHSRARRRQERAEGKREGGSATATTEPGLIESAQSGAMESEEQPPSTSMAEEPTAAMSATAESLATKDTSPSIPQATGQPAALKRPRQDGDQERKRSSQDLCQARKRHAGDAGRSPLYRPSDRDEQLATAEARIRSLRRLLDDKSRAAARLEQRVVDGDIVNQRLRARLQAQEAENQRLWANHRDLQRRFQDTRDLLGQYTLEARDLKAKLLIHEAKVREGPANPPVRCPMPPKTSTLSVSISSTTASTSSPVSSSSPTSLALNVTTPQTSAALTNPTIPPIVWPSSKPLPVSTSSLITSTANVTSAVNEARVVKEAPANSTSPHQFDRSATLATSVTTPTLSPPVALAASNAMSATPAILSSSTAALTTEHIDNLINMDLTLDYEEMDITFLFPDV